MKILKSLVFLLLTAAVSHAQPGEAYIIPRHIFVGDPAMLVLPLPAAAQNHADIVIASPSDFLPNDPDIDFHKITLERRVTGSRLMIEFTAFVPGIIELPVIEIGGEYFTGLTFTVNSVIGDLSSPVLSGPAPSLAAPGTALMLYGSLAGAVILILLIILFISKGRPILKNLIKTWKLRRLFNSIRKTEKQLRRALQKTSDKRVILDKLSDEFRIFLSNFTGNNCRAMTASELEQIDDLPPLGGFFRRLDNFRFSGGVITSGDLEQLLDDLKNFIDELEKEEKAK